MEQRDVRPDRRDQEQRSVAIGIVDHAPVGAMRDQVRADHAAQRQERHALLGRLQARMDRRAGRIAHLDRPRPYGGNEARRRPVLVEGHRRRLDAAHAAGTDQEIGLEAQLRHADQVQIARATTNQSAHDRERAARIVGREGETGTVRNAGGEALNVTSFRLVHPHASRQLTSIYIS